VARTVLRNHSSRTLHHGADGAARGVGGRLVGSETCFLDPPYRIEVLDTRLTGRRQRAGEVVEEPVVPGADSPRLCL
jgi:hypothetical protein